MTLIFTKKAKLFVKYSPRSSFQNINSFISVKFRLNRLNKMRVLFCWHKRLNGFIVTGNFLNSIWMKLLQLVVISNSEYYSKVNSWSRSLPERFYETCGAVYWELVGSTLILFILFSQRFNFIINDSIPKHWGVLKMEYHSSSIIPFRISIGVFLKT